MILTNENATLNAKIKINDEIAYVVKINKKSFYAAKDLSFLSRWNAKVTKNDWKGYCKQNDVKMLSYDKDIEVISDGEKISKTKRILSIHSEAILNSLCKIANSRSKKSFQHIIEMPKERFYILQHDKEKQKVVMKINDEYFNYNYEKNQYSEFDLLKYRKKAKI